MEKLLTYCGYQLSYEVYGSGKQCFLAIHGFDRFKEDYEKLAQKLGSEYKIIAFDFFHHGNSLVLDRKKTTKEDFGKLISEMLRTENITKFSVIGYSMGGRFALCLTEYFEKRVSNLILIAPDGVKISKSHKFAGTWLGKFIFKNIVLKYPNFCVNMVKFFSRIRLVPKSLGKFVVFYIGDKKKRELVYNVWMSSKYLFPKHSAIINKINDNKLKLTFVFGKYDRILPSNIGHKFNRRLKNKAKIHEIESGHAILKEEYLDEVSSLIKQNNN